MPFAEAATEPAPLASLRAAHDDAQDTVLEAQADLRTAHRERTRSPPLCLLAGVADAAPPRLPAAPNLELAKVPERHTVALVLYLHDTGPVAELLLARYQRTVASDAELVAFWKNVQGRPLPVRGVGYEREVVEARCRRLALFGMASALEYMPRFFEPRPSHCVTDAGKRQRL